MAKHSLGYEVTVESDKTRLAYDESQLCKYSSDLPTYSDYTTLVHSNSLPFLQSKFKFNARLAEMTTGLSNPNGKVGGDVTTMGAFLEAGENVEEEFG